MAKVKKLGVFSFALLQAVIMAMVGLIAGILYSVGGFFYDLLTIGLNFGTALAFLALPGMPVTFAIFGFIFGLVEAFLYNLFALWFGGLEIKLEQ